MEYGNYYERAEVFRGYDFLANYDIQREITRAKSDFPDNFQKQRDLVRRECSHDWPVGIDDPALIRRAGLQNRTKDAMRDVYKEYNVQLAPDMGCLVRAFYYQDKRWFYWWDMYQNYQLIRTGLEFFPFDDHPASYIFFATDPKQSPLMCTAPFKHIRQEKIC